MSVWEDNIDYKEAINILEYNFNMIKIQLSNYNDKSINILKDLSQENDSFQLKKLNDVIDKSNELKKGKFDEYFKTLLRYYDGLQIYFKENKSSELYFKVRFVSFFMSLSIHKTDT